MSKYIKVFHLLHPSDKVYQIDNSEFYIDISNSDDISVHMLPTLCDDCGIKEGIYKMFPVTEYVDGDITYILITVLVKGTNSVRARKSNGRSSRWISPEDFVKSDDVTDKIISSYKEKLAWTFKDIVKHHLNI